MRIMAITPTNNNQKTTNVSNTNNKTPFGMKLVHIPADGIDSKAVATIRTAIGRLQESMEGVFGTAEHMFVDVGEKPQKTLYGLTQECNREIPGFETKPVGVRIIPKGKNIEVQIGNTPKDTVKATMPKSLLSNYVELTTEMGRQVFRFASGALKKQSKAIETQKPKLFPPYCGVLSNQ